MWNDVLALTHPIVQTDKCVHIHMSQCSVWHRDSCTCVSLSHKEVWGTISQDHSRAHAYSTNFTTATHNRRVLRILICLISPNVFLLATLPLYCIRSHHGNWQPADTADHHAVLIGCALCTITHAQVASAEWGEQVRNKQWTQPPQ